MSFTKLKSVYKQRTGNTFEDTQYIDTNRSTNH